MDIKAFLRSYRPALIAAQKAANKLDAARETGIKSPRLDGMPRSGGGNGLDDQLARIDALERRLHKERERALAIAEIIQDMIESLEDINQRNVLRMRYLDGLTWVKIGMELNYAERTLYTIHGQALTNLRRQKWELESGKK